MKKILSVVLIGTMFFSLAGCGKKALVEKKEKSEYTASEVKKVIEKAGYKITESEGSVFISNEDGDSLIGIQSDDKLAIIMKSFDKGNYVINLMAKNEGARPISEKECIYDVENEEVISNEGKCGTLAKEEATEIYKEFYGWLLDLNLTKDELISVFE